MSHFLTSYTLFAWVLILSFMLCNSNLSDFKIRDCTSSLSRCNQSLTGHWPQNPREFTAKVKANYAKEIVFKLSWKSSSKNLQCIHILIRSNGIPDICKILDFMDRNDTYADRDFEYKVPFTNYTYDYVIEARSLPQRNSEAVSRRLYDCTKWYTSFEHIYDGDQIKVTFVQGPQRCNFENYSVSLYDIKSQRVSRKIVYEKINGTNLTAVFSHHLCKGQYYILIQKAWDTNKQGCLRVDGQFAKCGGTRSQTQTYIPRIPCDKNRILAKSVPEKVEKFHLTYIIGLVCVFSITAFGLLIIYIFKRQQSQPRKRGMVLFVDDYPAHTKAVLKLVDYLRECSFDIRLVSQFLRHNEDSDQLIVLSEALKSNFVLLVVSCAFQKRMEAWNKQQDYVEFFKDRNSNLLTRWFLEKLTLWNKLYLCKFDHVSDCHSWPERCYSLPSHLTEMVKDLVGDGFKLSFLTCHQKKALSQLDDAVRKAADYEHSNSNWFHQKYFCPRAIVTEENGFSEHLSNWK